MWIRLLLVTLAIAQATAVRKPVPGRSLPLFRDYGYLLNHMRAVPEDVQTHWAWRIPTDIIFENYSIKDLPPYNEFYMYVCKNMSELKDAYFNKFYVEGQKSHNHPYTAGWSAESKSKYFGIDKQYTDDSELWYVLVRMDKTFERKRFDDKAKFDITQRALARIRTMVYNQDTGSTRFFIENLGSHYIKSYASGDSLYQVFVYGAEAYAALWDKMLNFNKMSEEEQKDALSPKHAIHIGQILSGSGERSVRDWARKEATVTRNGLTYSCLAQFKFEPEKFKEACSRLEDRILLGLDLRHVSFAFPTDEQRHTFKNVAFYTYQDWAENYEDTYHD